MRRFLAHHPDSCFNDAAAACLELHGTLEQEALLSGYAQEAIRGLLRENELDGSGTRCSGNVADKFSAPFGKNFKKV